jgi:hypothetical protein
MDDGLRGELLRRVDKDQAARLALDVDAMTEADSENLPWLKELIAARGWPGASLVGADGAHHASVSRVRRLGSVRAAGRGRGGHRQLPGLRA